MLRDDEGNLAYSKVIVVSVFFALLLTWIAVGVLLTVAEDATAWTRYEGWMKWGSATFLGSGTIFHIGHRATDKSRG